MFTSGHLISKSSLMPESIMAVYISTVGVRAFGIMRSVSRYVERFRAIRLSFEFWKRCAFDCIVYLSRKRYY